MPSAPVKFLVNSHLSRVSRQSCLSPIKSYNDMVSRAVHRSHDIYHTAVENLEKPQLGECWRRLCKHSLLQMVPLTSKWRRQDSTVGQGWRRKQKGKDGDQAWPPHGLHGSLIVSYDFLDNTKRDYVSEISDYLLRFP